MSLLLQLGAHDLIALLFELGHTGVTGSRLHQALNFASSSAI